MVGVECTGHLTKRSMELTRLGFTFDSDLQVFLLERKGMEPYIITKHFVADAPNETFFSEFYRIRKKLLETFD